MMKSPLRLAKKNSVDGLAPEAYDGHMFKKLNIPFARVNWTNTAFLSAIALLAVVASPIYLWKFGFNAFQLSMFLFYAIATGMSITLGYHRLFSHFSFKAKWPVRMFTLIFGACAFENSALNWCSDHRRHHKHTDHDDDPYDISKGFFWAHMGWILFKLDPIPPLDNVNDLRKDDLVMWQYRWDKFVAFGVGLVLPAILGYFFDNGWQGALGGFLLAGVMRVFFVQQCTFFINSLCHTIGNQPYSTRCSARDSFVMSLFTFGEGYHNYHHEFQHDYRNGVKRWNFDPTKWAIWLLAKVGMAEDLRRVPESRIVLAEMVEARRKAEVELQKVREQPQAQWRDQVITALESRLEQVTATFQELEKNVADRVELSRNKISHWKAETRKFRNEISAILARIPVRI